jgi:pantetheine-phosphate adenylyltransferase
MGASGRSRARCCGLLFLGEFMSSSPVLTAVYPGTFDPMTLGHADLMRRASQLWDRLILAVAAGHHKKTMFSLDERLDMARELAAEYPNVEVVAFSGLLRDFVVAHQGKIVVRGLRAVSDFEYEFQMAGMNRQLMPEVETVFLTPSDQFQFVSGTFVREIAMLGGDVSKFVAPSVLDRLKARVARQVA